jgi:hypothetical protein
MPPQAPCDEPYGQVESGLALRVSTSLTEVQSEN